MSWWIWILVMIYVVGFVVTFLFHLGLGGMVSPGLSLLRSLLWPIFWVTGWPSGRRLPMD